MENNKAVEITNLTDAALDAVLSVRSGEDFVDAAKLTIAERASVAEALGWEMNASTRLWIQDAPYSTVEADRRHLYGPDFEAMILEEQEDEGRNI